jgi:excisionase family DNA binding protein
MQETDERREYTISEIAQMLNYHPDTVRYWVRVGEIIAETDQQSGDWLIRDDELVAFLRVNGEAVPDSFSAR